MNHTDSGGRLRIIRVEATDRESLDIQLSNGNLVILQNMLVLELPGFEGLADNNRILHPKTDGKSIYWRDGPRPLGIDEFLALIGKVGTGKAESNK